MSLSLVVRSLSLSFPWPTTVSFDDRWRLSRFLVSTRCEAVLRLDDDCNRWLLLWLGDTEALPTRRRDELEVEGSGGGGGESTTRDDGLCFLISLEVAAEVDAEEDEGLAEDEPWLRCGWEDDAVVLRILAAKWSTEAEEWWWWG